MMEGDLPDNKSQKGVIEIEIQRPTGPRITAAPPRSLGELIVHQSKNIVGSVSSKLRPAFNFCKKHKKLTISTALAAFVPLLTHALLLLSPFGQGLILAMSDTRVSTKPYIIGPTSSFFVVPSVSTQTCTGGSRSSSGGDTIITFSSSGTLNCPSFSFSAKILVVAGGGGGGGGGGGAGGYCTTEGTPTCGLGSSVTIPSGNTTVTVGNGGTGDTNGGTSAPGNDGQDSVLGSIVTAIKGSGGGAINVNCSVAGGSGGGAGADGTGGPYSGCSGTAGQGNNGGGTTLSVSPFAGAGGGGASAVGSANVSDSVAGNGGAGVSNSISGSAVTYAAGGGGHVYAGGGTAGNSTCAGGTGGGGGGGGGCSAGGALAGGNGGSGGGGGGAAVGGTGGTGGNGVVIIRCTTGLC